MFLQLCSDADGLLEVKPATDESQNVREMRKICETQNVCTVYFVFFILLHETDFLCIASQTVISVEAVIMHETKRFSRAIWNKTIV